MDIYQMVLMFCLHSYVEAGQLQTYPYMMSLRFRGSYI